VNRLPALLAMALLAANLPKGKGRREDEAPTLVESITVIQGPETRQQRRARERREGKAAR